MGKRRRAKGYGWEKGRGLRLGKRGRVKGGKRGRLRVGRKGEG